MISVKPYKPFNDNASYRLGFIVEGHAEFAPHGQDIVCAGVSAIVQTAIMGLDYYNPTKIKKKDGYISVFLESDDHTSDTIIKTMLLGLRALQVQYPDNIKVQNTGETM